METIDLRQKPTTIWIKKGTKDELDSLGSRKDTYDDIIKNILIQNSQLKQKMEQLEESMPKAKNILSVSENIRKEITLTLGKNTYAIFSYIPPPKIIDESYRMNINLSYIQKAGKKIKPKEYYKDNTQKLKDYLNAAESIIKANINPLFKIDNEKLLDIQEWKRLFKNNGLSEQTLKTDIKEEFIQAGLIV
ncbi:MAG: hypothetical protein KKC75_08445 [Nanoarchaeota archaeon]|nr:hypothetical protein [Nanoarchaeota archaeon]MBU1005388.1 hypothetical protein [Nanoarchaeota archaeon]MBU1945670.1 hypothetical protein [Nanoarchaeota archaeon]